MKQVRAVLSAMAAVALSAGPQAFAPSSATAIERAQSGTPEDAAADHVDAELPAAAAAAISAAIGRDQHAYHAVTAKTGLRMSNRDHGLGVAFGTDGVVVEAGAARWGVRLRGYGTGGVIEALPSATPQAIANRLEYRRGALTERYVNGPHGLEQSFTLSSPPAERPGGGSLSLDFDLSGDLRATVDADGRGLSLRQANGAAWLRYVGLSAYDVTGRELSAHLDLAGAALRIVVDDRAVRYPLTIDAVVQQAHLTASDGELGDLFGFSVATSGDTVVVGSHGSEFGRGAAYVFVEPSGGWAMGTETAKLTASDSAPLFGGSVAISGNTIVVGAEAVRGANAHPGAAYVFVEPAQGWTTTTETAKLTASGGPTDDNDFAASVAVSDDTIVVGAPLASGGNDPDQGAAYVFVEPSGGWTDTIETARLTASFGGPGEFFGGSVAVDDDTVVVGAVGSFASPGTAYVFVAPGAGWITATETATLHAADEQSRDAFGFSVAVSGDTVVIGAVNRVFGQGTAYVFVEPSGGWTDTIETAVLTASDLGDPDQGQFDNFGYAVGVSGDTVVVGSRGNEESRGAAYVFVEPAGGWVDTTETVKLVAADRAVGDEFGFSVAVVGDTVAVGAWLDDIASDDNQGSAYVFEAVGVNDRPTVRVTPGGVCGADQRSATINLNVTDPDNAPGGLTLTASSSNPALLPAGNISFAGSGAVRTMSLATVVGRTGTAVVTVTVSDGQITGTTTVAVQATGHGGNSVQGTSIADVILAQGGNDAVSGWAGKDLLCGGLGQDYLVGGDGDDTLRSGGGASTLYGGDGNDRLDGGNLVDNLYGGDGNDRLAGGHSNDGLVGGPGDDIFFGGRGDDTLGGDEGNDRLTGNAGGDFFSGGPGTDTATDLNPATGDRQDGTIP